MADEKQAGLRLSDVPANLKQVNDLVADLTVKLGNMAATPALRVDVKPFESIENHVKNIAHLNKKWAETIGERAKALKDINQRLKESIDKESKLKRKREELRDIQQKQGKLSEAEQKRLDSIPKKLKRQKELQELLEKQQGKIVGKWTMIGKLIAQDVLQAIDNLGKSLITLSFDLALGAIEMMKKGFLAVYDLVDRTVKATGEFRDNIGATTVGLKDLEKAGWELEGTLRGLGKIELGIGLKEMSEATKAFGFADKDAIRFTKTAVMAGKALGVGSTAAGELARQFKLSGEDGQNLESSFMDISRAANAAGVPVSEFTKEIGKSTAFMASFGKKARQVFLDSAAYARKYGLSIKSLEGFVDLTDTFEGTATAAAKLNTIFGTSVNAMELMLSDDPAQRLEMVRKALTAQGKSWDTLSRQERKFLSETVKIAEDELQGLLTSKKTYADFQKDKERARKKEMDDQKAIQKATLMTAKTLNNWSATFDRITASFKPILDDILGKDFWGNVSKNVGKVVGKIQEFFNMVRSNKDVQEFIAVLRDDFGSILKALSGDKPLKNSQQLSKAISTGARFLHKFYDAAKDLLPVIVKMAPLALKLFGFLVENAGTILAIWAGLKLFSIGSTIFTGISSLITLLGGGATVMGAIGTLFSAIGTGLAAIGTAIAPFISAIVGVVGPILGVAAALAAAATAGYLIGTALRKLFPQIDTFTQKLMDAVVGFFDSIWGKLVHTTFYKTVFGDDAAKEYDKKNADPSSDLGVQLGNLVQASYARGGSKSDADAIRQRFYVEHPEYRRPNQVEVPAPKSTSTETGGSRAASGAKSGPENINITVQVDSEKVARAQVKRQGTQ